MAGEDIYVDLFSNASLDIYPENRVSNFTVKLDQPLELVGEYECAVAQFNCPSTVDDSIFGEIVICTLPETPLQKSLGRLQTKTPPFNDSNLNSIAYRPSLDHAVKSKIGEGHTYTVAKPLSNQMYSWTYKLPKEETRGLKSAGVVALIHGVLNDPPKIAKQNEGFGSIIMTRQRTDFETTEPITLRWRKNNKLDIHIRDPDMTLALSPKLARAIGLKVADSQWVVFQGARNYQFPTYQLNANTSGAGRPDIMAIYTDVTLPHRVGDTTASLIRVCAIPPPQEGLNFLSFDFVPLHYLPVAIKYIPEIQIEIRGNSGELIPFDLGLVYLRLHFRLRRGR